MGRRVRNTGFPPGLHLRGMKARNFALAPLEMLLLHPAWINPLPRLLQEPQTLQTPPNMVPCPPEFPSAIPGVWGELGYLRTVPRDALGAAGRYPGMLDCLWG